MPRLKNRISVEKHNDILVLFDPLGVVLGWYYGGLMVVLWWPYGCLRVGLCLGLGWPWGVPGFNNKSTMETQTFILVLVTP